jgi:hypothetical protein
MKPDKHLLRFLYDNKANAANHATKNPYNHLEFASHGQKKFTSALITGGVGDFLAIEPFILRNNHALTTIYLATNGHHEIGALIRRTYPKLQIRNIISNFPKDRYCFLSKEDVRQFFQSRHLALPEYYETCHDYSIGHIFPKIKNKSYKFQGSSYVENNLANLDKYNLPKQFAAIVTASTRDKSKVSGGRNLNSEEIDHIVKTTEMPLVCVFCQCDSPHPGITHHRFSPIFDSIEIVKRADAYFGVDSCLSVIAGYTLPSNKIFIKSINQHCSDNIECYYNKIHSSLYLYKTILEIGK